MTEKSNAMDELAKIKELYSMCLKWLAMQQQGRNIIGYFQRKDYKKVAIYGLGDIGMLLYDELDRADIGCAYVIDQRADYMNPDIDAVLYTPEDELPEADVVVVTAIHYFDEIKSLLSKKVDCPILSLKDVLKEV